MKNGVLEIVVKSLNDIYQVVDFQESWQPKVGLVLMTMILVKITKNNASIIGSLKNFNHNFQEIHF